MAAKNGTSAKKAPELNVSKSSEDYANLRASNSIGAPKKGISAPRARGGHKKVGCWDSLVNSILLMTSLKTGKSRHAHR